MDGSWRVDHIDDAMHVRLSDFVQRVVGPLVENFGLDPNGFCRSTRHISRAPHTPQMPKMIAEDPATIGPRRPPAGLGAIGFGSRTAIAFHITMQTVVTRTRAVVTKRLPLIF